MSTIAELTMRMSIAKAARDEKIVKSLLGQWVSEFEPAIAMHNGEIIGLCVAGDPSGDIPVRVMDMRPTVRAIMRAAGMSDDIPTINFRHDLGYD